MKNTTMTITRCAWANPANPRYLDYHDTEWGVPCHDERRLFEMLNLEGAQAGTRKRSPRMALRRWRSCWRIPASCATA